MEGRVETQFLQGGDLYVALRDVLGGLGEPKVKLGRAHWCRYCGSTAPAAFRKVAHTFPEALGNKWVVSLDECDACNQLFSTYESALAASVAPLLTLGGIRGKSGVRETDRSDGRSHLSQSSEGTQRRFTLSARQVDAASSVSFATDNGGTLRITFPLPPVSFRPRHAYKALAKMAFALLAEDELAHYSLLREWLRDKNDEEDFPCLEVAMSLTMTANSPPFVRGTLLRRCDPRAPVPHTLFILTAGSICLQIDLPSDHHEDHIEFMSLGDLRVHTRKLRLCSPNSSTPFELEYSNPVHMNWASTTNAPQPIAQILLEISLLNQGMNITPIFRQPVTTLNETD